MRPLHRTATTVLAACLGLALAVPPALAAAGPAAAAPASAQTTADPLLRAGSTGSQVRQWQGVLNRVIAEGLVRHPRLAEDGVFGPATRRATLALQARLGVTQDGVVGPVTRGGVSGLLDGQARPAPAPATDRLLRAGATGEDVRAWQQVLNRAVAAGEVAHARIGEDGVFGPRTTSATVALQRRLGVTRDGVVGPVTRDGVAGLLG